jgi:hypothetical protein
MLESLKQGPVTPILRWCEILPPLYGADETITLDEEEEEAGTPPLAPRFRMQIQFTNQSQMEKIGERYPNRLRDKKQMRGYQRDVFAVMVKGWENLTHANLKRLTDYALEHPADVAKLPSLIDFTPENRDWLAEHITARPAWGGGQATYFSVVVANGQMHDAFVQDEMDRRKNGSGPSSVSD